ncbi:hypothetical protein ScPMuIL_016027 [Solemya velum]
MKTGWLSEPSSILYLGKVSSTMVLLACNCLNVKIIAKGDNLNNNHQTDITPKNTNEVFFTRSPVQVELEIPGITQEHPYLVHRRQVGEWIVYKCLVCDITTHAKTIKSSTMVLVSQQLQQDSTVIERLMKSPDFSPAFQIVLQNQDTAFRGIVPDPMSRSYESLQSQLNSIQQHLSTFLLDEEAAMEARIRAFEEEQREHFNQLQDRVRNDKKNVISLLIAAAKMDTESSKHSLDRQHIGGNPLHQGRAIHQTPTKITSKPPVSRTKSMPVQSRFERQVDTEAMFVLDDELQQDQDEPFYISDGDEEDDNDTDEASSYPTGTPPIYSSSVPVTVPKWPTAFTAPSTGRIDDEPEKFVPTDPDQMAASMQALAQSITDDERYIFGDRPRPRLNTGDFTLTRK